MTSLVTRFKAPNILILTELENDFNSIKNFIRNLLGINSYTIYNIKLSQLKSTPAIWMDNCCLLVTVEHSNHSKNIYEEKFSYIKKYLKTGGKILSIPSCYELSDKYLTKYYNDLPFLVYNLNYDFELDYENESVCKETDNAYYNTLNLAQYIYSFNKQHWVSKIVPNYYDLESLNETQKSEFFKSDATLKQLFLKLFLEEFKLKLIENSQINRKTEPYYIFTKSKLLQSPSIISSYLTDCVEEKSQLCIPNDDSQRIYELFNSKEYFNNLTTTKIGHIVLFSEIASSTMNALNNLPYAINNVVAIARQQINGQGNNNNEWLSPLGCAMFTIFINLNTNTFQSSRLCLLQYAAAISCVEAILQTPGYENVPVKIKWPNDIIIKNSAKLGGILVKSSILGDNLLAQIGIGVNIDNEHPTISLNSVLSELNLNKWSCEKFIAQCLNRLEYHIDKLRYSHTLDKFRSIYQDYWLHKDQNVHVEYWNEDVTVIGIDNFGYLQVKRQNGEINILQPDGNRFDMMRNLIVFK